MKKWIWILISVLVVGYVGYQWFHSRSSASTSTASQVRTAAVQKGKLEVTISGSGTVEPVTTEDIKATADNNEIDEVLVSAGDTVSAGETLVTFTDDSDPITAPTAGTITTVSVASGDRINKGMVVAHLTNYNDLQTVVQVDELDIPKVKVGQTVTLSVSAYPDATYTGKVTAVAEEGTSTNGSSTFAVTIHIEKPTNLKVGMSTEATILTASKTDALYVPADAIYTNNNEKYVIVDSTGTSTDSSTTASGQQKTVKTGISTDEYVEITEGVTEGETVELPQLSSSSSSTNQQGGMMQGMGGMQGGMGQMPSGNMQRSGQGMTSGKSGN
ncbi:HlyD family efflux transporter periplasmic adaptor subunit [Neobacillus drentensis]|uniref:efflux RND transporter periplasmic adaptor subunit n=1 Tax=Neobacillus drentensis TaxID=220684 RepID=UPI001F3FBB57|nr:HlyD family efflux transporter periplasmic adaptor subunit [Neobacillus drentensis]ULT57535.1 HlyD family efflux transporter periplasmic adaptor subunit [Neobacillus drentensis]